MDPVVVLEGIGVRIGGDTILRDVELELARGETLGLFGANGAGKTTLLRLMATLLAPSHGGGTVVGVDIAGNDYTSARPSIGYVGHTPGLYGELTLRENIRFSASIAGIGEAEADAALGAVGLAGAADRRVEATSHGMQRRAEFALQLARKPRLLLLDEPHSALDAAAVDLVESLVERTTAVGGAAVLVSHDRERVAAAADRTVELKSGTLV